jgi:hypothetical protein
MLYTITQCKSHYFTINCVFYSRIKLIFSRRGGGHTLKEVSKHASNVIFTL